jgi:transposase-like protein
VIHTEGWRGNDGLVDLGYEKHFRVNHVKNIFSSGDGNHIWGYAKHRLTKFNNIRKEKLIFYLKESEFRFNHRKDDIYHFLLKNLREKPL